MTTPMGRNWLYYYLSVRSEYYDLMLPKRRYPDGKDKQATENASGEGDMGMAGDTRDDKAGPRCEAGRSGQIRPCTSIECPEHGQSVKEVLADCYEGREEEAVWDDSKDYYLQAEYHKGEAEGHKELADHYQRALNEIRRRQGLVCEHYELCQHTSCRSSYTSWAIADFALRHAPGMPFQEDSELLASEIHEERLSLRERREALVGFGYREV